MISLLSRFFIRERKNYKNEGVRRAYGMLCGALGIFLNLLLFGIKFLAAFLTGSVAISADAFNNLSDAGSSIITLLGFHLAGQKPDPDHPFGHGRIEYVSGFIVSMLILLMGFELGKSSLTKITSGSEIVFHPASVVILVISIFLKFYMYFYNTRLGKRTESLAMKATGADCLVDCLSTSVVLLSSLISHFTSLNLDGWCGLAVAAFILFTGLRTAKETLDPLLGTNPPKELVNNIQTIVLSFPYVCGIHDLIVHNYGPGRTMISLHAEVPQDCDILEIHDIIDNMERKLSEDLGCHAVVHMDPIVSDNPFVSSLRCEVAALASEVHPSVTIHDFRIVQGNSHTNLIFDMVVPYDCKMTDIEAKNAITARIQAIHPDFFTVIQIDRSYIS